MFDVYIQLLILGSHSYDGINDRGTPRGRFRVTVNNQDIIVLGWGVFLSERSRGIHTKYENAEKRFIHKYAPKNRIDFNHTTHK